MPSPNSPRRLELFGASTHNLQGVDASFPLGGWTALCGVSGSGKSSLAFHTLHAEAERRWLSTLPTWRRLLAEALPRPPLRGSSGLVPTAALRQESSDPAGGTLASLAGLREPLAALWSAASVPVSPRTGETMRSHAPDEAAQELVALGDGTRLQVAFQAADTRPGTWVRRGFLRGVVATGSVELESLAADDPTPGLLVVVDRLLAQPKMFGRIVEALQTAYRLGGDLAAVEVSGPQAPRLAWYSGVPRCHATGETAPRPVPGLFSTRSTAGACPTCLGSGGDGGNCPTCGGSGLRPEAGWFRLGGRSLPEFCATEVADARLAVATAAWDAVHEGPCRELVQEVRDRLRALEELGLGYLPLSRSGASLSEGEERRARLAALVGAPLSGLAYVLDEPTTGLHPNDLPRVHDLLSRLRDGGATLVVVEHDLRSLSMCDHVLETGPVAGALGGRIVFAGPPSELPGADTPSGRWLAGEDRRPRMLRGDSRDRLVLRGIVGRNLSIPEVSIPLGRLVCVSGVSGAGKSSLVQDCLVPALRRHLGLSAEGISCRELSLGAALDEVHAVEAGGEWVRSVRSTVATLSGMLDELRPLFASLPESKARGFAAGRFSPNAKGGRCERCEGVGEERVRLHLLPDAWVPCSRCGGSRYEPATLEIRWKGLSIADILELPLDRAADLFQLHPKLGPLLSRLSRSGLSHLSGGRRADSLSGGEALRLRLASAVHATAKRRTLWALDEPTRGLHPRDTQAVVGLLDDLVAAGHTVVATTHDSLLLSQADHVLELGPGPGREGGRLLYAGTPQGLSEGSWPSSASVARELS